MCAENMPIAAGYTLQAVARNERVVDAPPEAVFRVLAKPRSYAYWVIGSREIRDADESWPAPGSRLHHSVNVGPLHVQDDTCVELVDDDRYLQLRARARPFGTARVKLILDPVQGGTRVTMIEDAADRLTAFVFQPLTHLFIRARNARSLDRLAELAEGRTELPGDEDEATVTRPGDGGAVVNPRLHGRTEARRRPLTAVGSGALAGLAGAVAMSVSTNAEMRLRGRPPSEAPVRAIERLTRRRIRGDRARAGAALGGHVVTSLGLGAARGAMDAAGMLDATAATTTAGLALVPEVVVVPALGAGPPPWRWGLRETAISLLHHAVYAGAVLAAYVRLRQRWAGSRG
jgi:uncharacterized protein YndB with AHSA1/START domain